MRKRSSRAEGFRGAGWRAASCGCLAWRRGITYPSRLEVLLHQDAEAALYSMAMGGWGVEACLGAGSDNNFMEWLRERGRRPCAQGEELERREEPVL